MYSLVLFTESLEAVIPQYQFTCLAHGKNKMMLKHLILPESNNMLQEWWGCQKDTGSSVKGLPTGQIWNDLSMKINNDNKGL